MCTFFCCYDINVYFQGKVLYVRTLVIVKIYHQFFYVHVGPSDLDMERAS